MKLTFKAEEIFEEIPGDPNNVVMNIPPELCKQMGWVEGDTLIVELEDGAITLKKEDQPTNG